MEAEVRIVQTGTLKLRSSCWEVQEQRADLSVMIDLAPAQCSLGSQSGRLDLRRHD